MSRCSKDQSQTPCVGSLPPASAASGANIAKPMAADGAFASRPTRKCPDPSDVKCHQSARAKKAASGALNSAQSSNKYAKGWMTKQALGRESQGKNGWEEIALGDKVSLSMRSPTPWPQAWRDWCADDPWLLQVAAIPNRVTDVFQFPTCDFKNTVGNIVAFTKSQYNLKSRSGEGVDMEKVTERIAEHPYVKWAGWGNQKLEKTTPDNHESSWNMRIRTLDGDMATVGLTRNKQGKDPQGRQITHYWIGQFSENLDETRRSRLVDFLLNVVGYKSWFFKYGKAKVWRAIDAPREEPPVTPPQKSTENDGLPVAPRPKSADSKCEALPLSTVSNSVSQTQVDYPLDTEVEPNVRKRVSKLNGILVDPRQPSGIAQESWSHRGLISAIVKDQPRETKAAEDMPPVAQIEKQFSVAQPPVALHPVIEQAPPADVSGEGSTQCLSEPLVAHSDHQAAGDEQPVSLTPPEHQPDIVRSPVCPTEHQQDVYDPQVALPKQERDAGVPPVALPPGEQDASEPAALPKQERDAVKPPVALSPGEQDASEHVHDAGQPLPEYVPEYVPEHVPEYGVTAPEYEQGVGEAFPVAWPPAPQHHFWPLLAEPMLDVQGLECPQIATRALQKAYTACFPAEAMDTRPLGFYAQYLKPHFEQMPDYDAAKSTNPTGRNFVARMAYDANFIERLMTKDPQDLPATLQQSEGWLYEALTESMKILPDFEKSNGWRKMPWSEFRQDERLAGNPSNFLHHLFAKHAGEVILVQRDEDGVVARPWNVNVHHPQFYLDAHINTVSKEEAELAAGFWWAKKKEKRHGAAGDALLRQLSGCDNSVLKAVLPSALHPDGAVALRHFKYHSLPSLVYECCSVANLLEIYTFYCMQPQICCRAQHWHRGGATKNRST